MDAVVARGRVQCKNRGMPTMLVEQTAVEGESDMIAIINSSCSTAACATLDQQAALHKFEHAGRMMHEPRGVEGDSRHCPKPRQIPGWS